MSGNFQEISNNNNNDNVEAEIIKKLLNIKINSLINTLDYYQLESLLEGNYKIDFDNQSVTIENLDYNNKDKSIIDIINFQDNDIENPLIYFIKYYSKISRNDIEDIEDFSGVKTFKGKKEILLKILNLLINHCSNINFTDNSGEIPFFVAFCENQVDILKVFFERSFQLYESFPSNANSKIESNSKSYSNSKSLFKIGININQYNSEWENALIHTYKQFNDLPYPAFPFLLNYGLSHCYLQGFKINNFLIDYNACDWNGKSLIMIAVERGDYSFLKNFLNTIIDINVQAIINILNRRKCNFYNIICDINNNSNSNSDTSSIVEKEKKKEALMKDITRVIESDYNKLDLEIPDLRKNTVLLQSLWTDDIRILHCLLQFGANPNAKDGKGHTPLMIASMRGKLAMVKLLIRYGANVRRSSIHDSLSSQYYENQSSVTALSIARENHHDDVVKYLLKHHAE